MFCIIVAVFLISVPGLIGSGLVKTTFFPFIEGDNLTISLTMQAGTRDQITRSELDRIEAIVWEVNEELSVQREDSLQLIQAVDKRIGPTMHNGLLNVQLLDGERRNMQSTDISSMIRERVGTVLGAENLSFAAFSPFGRPVSVSLLGNNLAELEAATQELKSAMLQREDLKDVIDNNLKGVYSTTAWLSRKMVCITILIYPLIIKTINLYTSGSKCRVYCDCICKGFLCAAPVESRTITSSSGWSIVNITSISTSCPTVYIMSTGTKVARPSVS